jgi:hypothetical protein
VRPSVLHWFFPIDPNGTTYSSKAHRVSFIPACLFFAARLSSLPMIPFAVDVGGTFALPFPLPLFLHDICATRSDETDHLDCRT